jgi:Tol biopolymer transport system component
VVYVADQDTPGAFEIYSVPVQGGTPVRLNTVLPSGVMINRFEITADSRRVIYNAPQDSAGVWELYSIPIQGPASAAIKLNPPLPPGGSVGGGDLADVVFLLTPDGSRVVYHADQETDERFELYSVPVDGPAAAGIKLNPPLAADGDVNWSNGPFAAVSPDSQWVVYRADQDTDGIQEMYSVPVMGPASAAVKLNGVPAPGGEIGFFQISPDSSRVIYTGDQLQDFKTELFSVPIEGPAGAGVKLNQPLPAAGDIYDFAISPDSEHVVYRGDQTSNEVVELYSVPIAGPASVGARLNKPLVGGQDVEYYYRISPDSGRVVYVADQNFDEVFELFSVPIGGSSRGLVHLNPELVPGGNVDSSELDISPDGQFVIYRADQEVDDRFELYSVPIVGPASEAVKLNTSVGFLAGDVLSAFVAPDSSRVAYRLSRVNPLTFETTTELYQVPIRGPGGASARVNAPLVSGGDVMPFGRYSPDGTYIVYQADAEQDDVVELFAAYVRAAVKHWDRYR